MLEYRYDTQLLIDGKNLDSDDIGKVIETNVKGDCLLAVGDDTLVKVHFHTNTPRKVLELCTKYGQIYDIVVEDMERQSNGLKG
jgi:dihydroxyacetone kinase-like predicted kinase